MDRAIVIATTFLDSATQTPELGRVAQNQAFVLFRPEAFVAHLVAQSLDVRLYLRQSLFPRIKDLTTISAVAISGPQIMRR